jgi:ATP-binding cassette subfamily A (ABC1) protein 3
LNRYLSNVLPQDQGIRKPFYFCFLPKYWKATPKQLIEEESLLLNENADDYELREGMEPLTQNQALGIQIRKLHKIYPGKSDEKVVAVNNLSIDIGTDQIMALLGHNGAGKSTTISILTGKCHLMQF